MDPGGERQLPRLWEPAGSAGERFRRAQQPQCRQPGTAAAHVSDAVAVDGLPVAVDQPEMARLRNGDRRRVDPAADQKQPLEGAGDQVVRERERSLA